MDKLPIINSQQEKEKIILFIKKTLQKQNIENVVIGMSGGIDSTVAFCILKEAVDPQNIFVAYLNYFESSFKSFKSLLKEAKIPEKNIYEISIKEPVNKLKDTLKIENEDKVRLGNIMARVRMTILYDLAKKNNALVTGTEDKSEFLLGYFTRFGDQASDLELIRHLYKTQVYQLAKYLCVCKKILNQKPSPDLWMGHTAQDELGFSYEEADIALHLYYDKKVPVEKIRELGFSNAEKIINFSKKNEFKHKTPYVIKNE